MVGKSLSKKSLASQLSDLFTPKPKDYDPEELDNGDDLDLADRAVEDVDDMESSGKLRLRPDIDLDARYAGKKASRKDAGFASESDADDDSELEGDQTGDASESDDGHAVEGDDLDSMESAEEELEELEGEGSSSEEDEDAKLEAGMHKLDVDEAFEKELDELEKEDEAAILGAVKASGEEVEKARAAQNQRTIWDNLMDVRIGLQKAVAMANRFPQTNDFELLTRSNVDTSVGQELTSSFSMASTECRDLLTTFLDIQQGLLKQNPAVPAAESGARAKRKRSDSLDDTWDTISQQFQRFRPFCDEIIDRWNRKTQLSAGMQLKKLKVLNQSVVAQIEQIVSDKDRIIRRSQLKRTSYRVFGKPVDSSFESDKENEEENEEKNRDAHLEDYDEEIYDDLDFYQQQLRELIENAAASTLADPHGDSSMDMTRKYLALRKLKSKQPKKLVDRRASKGRKVRYVVHEKLVNFMNPIPRTEKMSADELFKNLFGRTVKSRVADSLDDGNRHSDSEDVSML
eukprot:GILK01007370.1.p1 GENE.GILK01007370.1~~GILK01007370.1.p1  ORF type:complete len:516 (-),score=116.90 GILK01007370.1:144-1691(-)